MLYRFTPITVKWATPLLARMKPDDALPVDHIDVLQHEMLIGVSGVICTKWEKFSSWLLAGFTASLALVLSNFDRVVSLTDRPAVYRVLIALGINVLLHLIQRVLGTMVAAGIAGGELGKKLPVRRFGKRDMRRLLDGMKAAYPPGMRRPLTITFDKLLAGDMTPLGRWQMRFALGALLCAVLQMAVVAYAVFTIASALHMMPA